MRKGDVCMDAPYVDTLLVLPDKLVAHSKVHFGQFYVHRKGAFFSQIPRRQSPALPEEEPPVKIFNKPPPPLIGPFTVKKRPLFDENAFSKYLIKEWGAKFHP